MADIVLSVEVREHTGTGGARANRREGNIPGVIYGGPRGPIAISLRSKEVLKAIHSGKFLAHLIEIDHKGERQPVIPKDVQFHPVTDHPMHIDLYRVEETQLIKVEVPVKFVHEAECPGIKRGGALNIVRHEVELWAPAGAIPEMIEIDLLGRDIGDVVHVSDVKLPQGVETVIKRNFTIATIIGRVAVDATPAADSTSAAS